jgi:hypothetical protein
MYWCKDLGFPIQAGQYKDCSEKCFRCKRHTQ